MKPKAEKIIFAVVCAAVVVGGFQALIYILNLYQIGIFIITADVIYLFLAFNIIFLYDLHFKTHPGKELSLKPALVARTEHFWSLRYIGRYFNYLLLPTLIFWSTVIVLYLNFGHVKIQQSIALFSSIALVAAYWYIKEIFSRRAEIVDIEIFVRMTVIKIYSAGLAYAAAMALMRSSYCLSSYYYAGVVFAITFSLIFQALFQHRLNSNKNLLITAGISLLQAVAGFFVYRFWGLNFYTAAILLVIIYNLMWGVFHYYLDGALTKKAFLEILIISLLTAAMIFGATNFRARILDNCLY